MEKLGCNTQNIISTTTTILSSSPKDGINLLMVGPSLREIVSNPPNRSSLRWGLRRQREVPIATLGQAEVKHWACVFFKYSERRNQGNLEHILDPESNL